MKNLIITSISSLLFSLSTFGTTPITYQNCMETIRQINTEMSFSRSDFVFDVGETNFGDEKVRTVFVKGVNQNYNAPVKQADGTYVQELVADNSKMRIFWNEKKELVKIRSSGVGTFDKDFFARYIDFETKNGNCVPLSYYSGSGDEENKKGQEFFNTKLCYELEKYLSANEERRKCLTQYGPELIAILDKFQKETTFPSTHLNRDDQVSMAVFGELDHCKTYKTLTLAQDFPLWEPPPTPEATTTPVATQVN